MLLRLAAAALLLAACSSRREAGGRDTAAPALADSARAETAAGGRPSRLAVLEEVRRPESARYDPDQDVIFVSNINGDPFAKDGNGFISRVKPDGTADSLRFIVGGRNHVTLNAPKGMAIVGETLWVADIDAVRGFDRRSGAPVATVDLAPMKATFLNDVVAASDGTLYITDSGIRSAAAMAAPNPGLGRIFAVRGRTARVAAEGAALASPNGIAWDAANGRFILGPNASKSLMGWKPGDAKPTAIADGPGQYDGIEVLGDGRVLATSWADSAVHAFRNGARLGGDTRIITGVSSPADIGYDTKRNRVIVPRLMENRVEIWQL